MNRHSLCLCALLSATLSCAQPPTQGERALVTVADIPMPGPAVRFDYQTFDPSSGRLYIAHMNADQLLRCLTRTQCPWIRRPTSSISHCRTSMGTQY